jgi:hypothetical protein
VTLSNWHSYSQSVEETATNGDLENGHAALLTTQGSTAVARKSNSSLLRKLFVFVLFCITATTCGLRLSDQNANSRESAKKILQSYRF